MIPQARFDAIASRYARLRVAVVGDVCLDRYLEIDPAREERSIETGLPVRNVVRVRSQPGGAGTVLANLCALGVGAVELIGTRGEDGEGWELERALRALPGVDLGGFIATPERDTFTYCKPLLVAPGAPPRELERLDRKNWSDTPPALGARLADAVRAACARADAVVVMEQVDRAGTGTVCAPVLEALAAISAARPTLPMLADSRVGLERFPPLWFKLNGAELAKLSRLDSPPSPDEAVRLVARVAKDNGRPVIATLAEHGIVAAAPDGTTARVPSLPLRGPIDVVGAGDSVTANLAAAFGAGAALGEALAIASAAASVVIHCLGTTGTASPAQIRPLLAAAAAR